MDFCIVLHPIFYKILIISGVLELTEVVLWKHILINEMMSIRGNTRNTCPKLVASGFVFLSHDHIHILFIITLIRHNCTKKHQLRAF